MAEVTLPGEMQYFPPSVAARARSYRQTVAPINAPGSGFVGGDKMKFVLGTTPGTYLNLKQSYIEFTLNNADDNAIRFDGHGSSVIERIEVYHAGALLDTVNNVNVLYNLLLDSSVSYADQHTTHIVGGVEALNTVVIGTTSIAQTPRNGATIAAAGSLRVAFPLIGIFGPAGMDRYLPLGDAVNGNVEVHVYLASNNNGVVYTNATTPAAWTITSAEYQAQLVEIDAAVHAALIAATGGIYSLPYNSFRHYGYNINASTTSQTLYISTKVSSMSAVILSMRPQSNVNAVAASSVRSRYANSLSSAQLRVGALNFPLRPIQCNVANRSVALLESLKIFGKLGTMMGGTSIQLDDYVNATPANSSTFFLAFDTQAYSAASAAVDDGLQAQHGSTYIQLEFSGTVTQAVVDVWVLFDGMLTVANGAISAAF